MYLTFFHPDQVDAFAGNGAASPRLASERATTIDLTMMLGVNSSKTEQSKHQREHFDLSTHDGNIAVPGYPGLRLYLVHDGREPGRID